ncbi:helicase-related protein [Pelagibacteraceae bacterium]|nr:helicase-related protein [Pelagibacteraceae bacterium]
MTSVSENISAILGPTNTGKTFLAFEKLFTYSTGIFGFPLRLLARENYDKAISRVGLNSVALITGEEKIVPKEARYFFCTVESMPIDKDVDCVIIDEVQLAADYERGHIFTDRILNLRGMYETIFLGSSNIQYILKQLFPNIKVQQKERFSKLSFLQNNNLSKLKPRSAIIAFNINKVYEIAENIRTHKGGAAVVLGSLSPRTRNAQVEIYESNKVDYLVATDAIGMGLNLNINHVCFTSLEKYDGRYNRNLNPSEIGQIAGRAGRYKNNGTFSHTKEAGILDPITIQSIENHSYNQIQKIYWRNSKLSFDTVEKFLSSLKQFPIKSFFIHKKNAIDEINFRNLIDENDIKPYLHLSKNIKLLWEVCRIPDFEKIFNDNYLNFLKSIFLVLVTNKYKIPEDWIKQKIFKLENFTGGIPELSLKISQIRTWTYISNHQMWLTDPLYWQEKTQKIENELSDNLHIGLTNKFIDSSSQFFLNASSDDQVDKVEINNKNEIILDGKKYGFIKGFDLLFNNKVISHSLFSLSHVKKYIRNMIEEKIDKFLVAPDDSINFGDISKIKLNDDTGIFWGDELVGKLERGSKIYLPTAEVYNSEFISSEKKLLISSKLQNWIDNQITSLLKPIRDKLDENLNSNVRAIAFNCFENLGCIKIDEFKNFINKIDLESKQQLSRLGIRIGAKFFFMPNLMKKKSMELNAILWKVFNKYDLNVNIPLPKNGRVSFLTTAKIPNNYWQSIGYLCINSFAFRIDVFEKIFYLARKKIKNGPFLESADLMNPIGCNSIQLKDILKYCGYEPIYLTNDKILYFFKQKKKQIKKTNLKMNRKSKDKKTNKLQKKTDPNSPFAVLEKLL